MLKVSHNWYRRCIGIGAAAVMAHTASVASAQHQTDTLSPVYLDNHLPYRVSVVPYDFGEAELPTLQSFAAGNYDGKWVLIAGRTNGLHGFELTGGTDNFPPEYQNRDVWVIDPVAKQSWRRSLEGEDGGFTTDVLNSLTPANSQFYQRGDRLYMTGGYGVRTERPNGTPLYGTFDDLSAIDLPGIIDWVTGGDGLAKDHIRQISEPLFQVTGGGMHEINGRTHLVFGQDFFGNYNPNKNGTYTNQVRNFDIVDDGTTLSIENPSSTEPDPSYRRRDLNVVPMIRPGDDGEFEPGLVVFSGVFTTNFGAWTVPVEIDANGNPTMDDPERPDTFKQSMNGYHSAKVGLFSESSGDMHQLLFGGISLQYLNTETGEIETDDALPFVNDITSIVIDEEGNYSQHRIGEYPILTDVNGRRLRFGANAEFFLANDIETYDNGVLKLDELTEPTKLGYIFGGIIANGPHTRSGDPPANSSASNQVFAVYYTHVPEPTTQALLLFASLGAMATAECRCRR